jgi:hypothetical protein
VRGCGFEIARFRGYSFVKTNEAVYMLTIVDGSSTPCMLLGASVRIWWRASPSAVR